MTHWLDPPVRLAALPLVAALAAAPALGLEYPIGKPQHQAGMEVAAVYLQPVPMEPAGIVAVPGEPEDGLTFWAATQGPHGVRDELAAKLGLDPENVRGANAAVEGST